MSVALVAFQDPQNATYAIKSFTKQPNGQFTASFPDGTVMSCQPGGAIQDRPAGANGDYECCDADPNAMSGTATFWPDHGTDQRYTKAWVKVSV